MGSQSQLPKDCDPCGCPSPLEAFDSMPTEILHTLDVSVALSSNQQRPSFVAQTLLPLGKKSRKNSQPYKPSSAFQIPDNFKGYPLNSFCIPAHYSDDLAEVLLPCGLILDRVERLAKDIAVHYEDQSFRALCVLKGGYKFFADLLDRVRQYNRLSGQASVPFCTDFIRIQSYVVGPMLHLSQRVILFREKSGSSSERSRFSYFFRTINPPAM